MAGVSQAVLFQRFGTKERMVRAALEASAPPAWVDLARRGPDHRPGRAQLLELGLAIHDFFDEMVPRWEALRGIGAPVDWKDDEPPPIRFHRLLSGWFTRAGAAHLLARHDARGVALAFLGALQVRAWFQHVAHQAPGRGARAYVETVVDMLWRGLDPGPRRRPPIGPRPRARTTSATANTNRRRAG